jgi:hypothetical protein
VASPATGDDSPTAKPRRTAGGPQRRPEQGAGTTGTAGRSGPSPRGYTSGGELRSTAAKNRSVSAGDRPTWRRAWTTAWTASPPVRWPR